MLVYKNYLTFDFDGRIIYNIYVMYRPKNDVYNTIEF